MDLQNKRLLITGGAGLIGSALASQLAGDNEIRIVDDLSNGIPDSVPESVDLVEGDITDEAVVADVVTEDLDAVFHLAAEKYVNTDRPREQMEVNETMTYNLLERMDEVGVDNILFTSSSTVYGEAPRPTPEDYAPLEPISVYGVTKLAEEGLLSVYAHSHDFTVWNFRFANIVGPRYGAGVIPDFVYKLQEDPESLTILGDGRQEKSYMHVDECVDAMCHVIEHAQGSMNTFNLGTRTTTSVTRIADIVADEMGIDPEYEYTGGDRGWTGDVPKMRLSIEKLAGLGWEPSLSSDEAVRQGVRDVLDEPQNEPHLSV
ncbi:NAD-dependent epimerase/dehydratase family protein [Halomicroarcula sp. F28]|uniref:NAD-dependent epimerase/dehydratase family protein n=1 Tax=Haloarcula salinisoli TaxID=2487746 RepID=UPI001C729F38|nr:NAD-dependent epimerase/dehydratase family protein [Halomicroarcula salinisoli]MBX0286452.1 NAD-dependent epimerase/dehydratase family protein [Halomicroarcula salinisoli]